MAITSLNIASFFNVVICESVTVVLKTAKMFQFGPKKRPRRGAVERGDVRKSLLYFSLKDAMPYFSGTTATERITGCYGLVM